MKIVIRMGRLIHKLQKERDMTILYIGKLGPGTKAFLLKNYEETDDAFAVGTSRSRGGSGCGGALTIKKGRGMLPGVRDPLPDTRRPLSRRK